MTLSFFWTATHHLTAFEHFLSDMKVQLVLRGKKTLSKILDKNMNTIIKIIKAHPGKGHGFFISQELQGYVVLEAAVDDYCMIGHSFHIRPLLEEFFVNPEYLVVNISLYDINVYKGDFQHLEIVKYYEFEKMAINMKSRFFLHHSVGLIPYRSILALKTIAQEVKELAQFDSLPVLVTGLDEMKQVFLKSFSDMSGIIAHINEDFYEKTCVEILEKCKAFRYAVMDFYSAKFKDRLKIIVKSKRLIYNLEDIIPAAREGRILQLVLPTNRKVYGYVDFLTGEFEIHKKNHKKNASVDVLNELAEEVIRQGGKIQILPPHFFPQNSSVLAILKG
jgi:hypothetical protein